MTDLHEMKQAAEAGKWEELKRDAEAALKWSDIDDFMDVQPAKVLELIADNERLKAGFSEPVRLFLDAAEQACAAQRERDQLKAENDRLKADAKLFMDSDLVWQGAREAEAEIIQLKAENEALRRIISESASACGAAVSGECSLGFMQNLPGEIASVIRTLRKDAELNAQLQRASEELPGAWSIEVCVERGSGWVDVFDDDGAKVEFDGEGSFANRVSDAIELAKESFQ